MLIAGFDDEIDVVVVVRRIGYWIWFLDRKGARYA
jgi:hypothetical protein